MNALRFKYFLCVIVSILLLSAAGAGCSYEDKQTDITTAGGQEAAPPRKTDVIVFIRDGEVWAINPNDGAERQVTNNRTTKVWPRISPDGRQVAYQEVMGDGSTTDGIYRVALPGGDPEPVNPLGAYPAWSTDGKSIACVVSNPASNGQQTDDIIIMDAGNPSNTARTVTEHKNVVDMGGPLAVQNLEYSPDGKYIYFIRGRRSDSRWLARVEVETGLEENISTPPGPMPAGLASGGFSLFNVSQMEGRRALISRGDLTGGNFQQNFKLYIRFLEPQLEDSMIEDTPGSINPSLKPDNTRFVYENQGVLYKHNLAGGPGIERIAAGSMPDWGMSAYGPGIGEDDTGTTRTSTGTTTGDSGGDNGAAGDCGAGDCGAGDIPGTEYIKNGDFENGPENWKIVDIKKKGSNSADLAADSGCGKIVVLTRGNSKNDGGLIGLEQSLDLELTGLSGIRLRMVSAIDSQALTSDGWYGGETPVFIMIDYTNTAGQGKTWTHGLMTAGSGVNYPERDQTIPADPGWYRYDSPDLLKAIPDAARITKVTIGGSGWDFRSRIGLISLKGSG